MNIQIFGTKKSKDSQKAERFFKERGIKFLMDSPTNQQFPIFSNAQLERLNKEYHFSVWQRIDEEHTAVRICTSWATKSENVDKLIHDIEQL